jgi:FMN phosphatase YigB (HAD superfamily)
MPYTAILFDLFDTLVLFDRTRLPLVTINGKRVHTTAGHLHAILLEHIPDVTLESCYAALLESWQEAERQRAIDHREVPAPERFAHFLRCLALDPATCPVGLVHSLLETHRRELRRAAEFPAHHGPLLLDLAGRVRLGVVSNFDYTPTALDILERTGVADLFGAIVVSDEIGWRKPRPEIFARALLELGVAAGETLFVGDRADIDVLGAQRAGMPAVWINRAGEALPPGLRSPEFEIRDLGELPHILELSG